MVKNTIGGSKTKSMARKASQPVSNVQYTPSDPLEKMATVTKLYGNGMCQIQTHDTPSLDLMCHIRGKFRGRSKKHNLIGLNSHVIVGLRDWESPYKNCDLISVLNSYHDPGLSGSNDSTANDSFVFSNEVIEENEIPVQKMPSSSIISEKEDDWIDIDDI
jgi:translation initiation factor IF-1